AGHPSSDGKLDRSGLLKLPPGLPDAREIVDAGRKRKRADPEFEQPRIRDVARQGAEQGGRSRTGTEPGCKIPADGPFASIDKGADQTGQYVSHHGRGNRGLDRDAESV